MEFTIERFVKFLLALLFVGAIAVLIFGVATGQLDNWIGWLLDLLSTLGFPPAAIASAKVSCASLNHVYGNQPTDGWVTAGEVTGKCTGTASSASIGATFTNTVTGFLTEKKGGTIRFKCTKNLGRAKNGKVGCTIQNFELPQVSDMGAVKKYAPGFGDPDFILYYGKYPKIEAQAAWSTWAALDLALTLTGTKTIGSVIKKGGKYLAKPVVGTVTRIPIAGRAASKAGKTIKLGAKQVKKGAKIPIQKGGELGFKGATKVERALQFWVRWAGEFGYKKLSGRTIPKFSTTRPLRFIPGADVGDVAQRASELVLRAEGGVYRFNLKAFVYLMHRNGIRAYDDVAAKSMIKHLEDAGKITPKLSDEALQAAKSDEKRLIQIMTKGEASVTKKQVDEAGELVEEAKIPEMDLRTARRMEDVMGLSTRQKAMVLTPKFLLIQEGTQSVDNLVGMQSGSGTRCVLTLRNADGKNMKFPIPNCRNNNVHDLSRSPKNNDMKAGVALAKTIEEKINVPFEGSTLVQWPARRTGFYAASPCLSQTKKGVGTSGATKKLIVYPQMDAGRVGEGQVYVSLPVATKGYSPNFCWHYSALDPTQWPGVYEFLNFIEKAGAPNIQKLSLGLSPWPCHGMAGLADLEDWMRGHGMGALVGQASGTCGGT